MNRKKIALFFSQNFNLNCKKQQTHKFISCTVNVEIRKFKAKTINFIKETVKKKKNNKANQKIEIVNKINEAYIFHLCQIWWFIYEVSSNNSDTIIFFADRRLLGQFNEFYSSCGNNWEFPQCSPDIIFSRKSLEGT